MKVIANGIIATGRSAASTVQSGTAKGGTVSPDHLGKVTVPIESTTRVLVAVVIEVDGLVVPHPNGAVEIGITTGDVLSVASAIHVPSSNISAMLVELR